MHAKLDLDDALGPLDWLGTRPLGPTTRREFMHLQKWREFLKIPG